MAVRTIENSGEEGYNCNKDLLKALRNASQAGARISDFEAQDGHNASQREAISTLILGITQTAEGLDGLIGLLPRAWDETARVQAQRLANGAEKRQIECESLAQKAAGRLGAEAQDAARVHRDSAAAARRTVKAITAMEPG